MDFRGFSAVALSAAALTACSSTANVVPANVSGAPVAASAFRQTPVGYLAPLYGYLPSPGHSHNVCGPVGDGRAHCDALLRDDLTSDATDPAGYHPADLQSAYNLVSQAKNDGAFQTVAVIDAYNDPNAAKDLAVYRATFGLPPCATSSGCLRIVNENGGTKLPGDDGNWAEEISLDLDMVSALCPKCKILLVEATSSYSSDLGASVNEAAKLGATEISNSYGGNDSSNDGSSDSAYYKHPRIAITASAGDDGYGVEYPAASPYVTAVGGTSLRRASSGRHWTETVWSDTGSGCSAFEAQPAWQGALAVVKNNSSVCTKRIVADVASDADPDTGVSVYDSYAYQGYSGWLVFGGTSVSAPTIAAVYALAGNAASVLDGSYPYDHTWALYDVSDGSNGICGGTYLCTTQPHYDGPTGSGTPNGTRAF